MESQSHLTQAGSPWLQILKNDDLGHPMEIHHLTDEGPSSQSYGFSNSHLWMWKLDHKECWTSNNWCFWTVVLEKTLESPLDCKEIQPIHPKGNQSWIFFGRTDAEAEAPIPWSPDAKSQLIRKDPDAGKDWRQEKGTWQRMKWLDGITDSMDVSLSKLKDREACLAAVHWVTKSQTWLCNWATTHCLNYCLSSTSCQISGDIRFS